ncbi:MULTISPECIES: ABC transporter ATP-binding protein [Actinoalloteichus]|uniref:ABC-type multidrug transport system, ATPase and permease component n=1 Tax=Actinoalloteichus fjordicus TaxID=1612552 RepID=A0AAC9PQN3_9PSEU|nr:MULTISPECIES: ABC transporter ATP-binding protein [Actinoalloteichus]APU13102.1 ABC-type multidrug transport system, ATPase and permease component [Actinoalloteichus fjordicus]APU19053.1 ABC-type multidrug transport system, ATPase and permease component [Actinoalloteichus sp. GBA129-24]
MSARTLPVAGEKTIRRFVGTLARRHKRDLAVVLLQYGLAAASGLVGPRLLGDMVQSVRDGTTVGHVTVLACALLGFTLIQVFLIRVAFRSAGRLAATVLAEIREKFVDDALALPLADVERSDDGDLVTRASRDVDMLRRTMQLAVPQVTEAVVWIVLSVGAILLVSWQLAFALLVIAPPLVLVNRWYLSRSYGAYLREAEASARITEGLSATVAGASTVEAFGLEADRMRRTGQDTRSWYGAVGRTLRLRTVLYPVEEFLFVAPLTLALLLGGYAYGQGWVDLGQVTAATLYILQAMVPLEVLLDWVPTLQQGKVSLARLLGVADTTTKPAPTSQDRTISSADLSTSAVQFGYEDGPDVLHGIDLTVRPGERLAIVGQTGSGKSTLARLLSGIYHPRAGAVHISGVPLHEIPLHELRQHVMLVTQDQYIFGGSLRDNLEMSTSRAGRDVRPQPDDVALWTALETVGASGWVADLPEKLDTAVGTSGEPLTDAQAQQLALARLLLADPPVVILDEATSQLSPGSARSLERALATVLAGRTVIAIAHRLHTAYDADRIAVMEHGRLVEVGSHQDLLDQGGAYARLWSSWL